MKKQYILLVIMLSVTSALFAQKIENDDMYFTSKDRAKLKESRKATDVAIARNTMISQEEEVVAASEDFNPTDSYSARNVNPEFTSRENSAVAQNDNEDYFVNNYQFAKQTQLANWNNNYNQWYNNQWYAGAGWAPGLSNSAYYGGFYDPWSSWGNRWYNPYQRNGWTTSISASWGNGWGNGWNSGWGMNYGMNYGYGWGHPMNNYWYNSWYSPAFAGWYSPFSPYGNYYGYPGTIVVVEGSRGRSTVYGKRPSRGSYVAADDANRSRSSSVPRNNVPNNQGGRISTASTRQEAYYSRPATGNGTIYQQNTRSNAQYNRSTWPSNSGNNNSSWSNSGNSRSTMSSGSPTRSHSSSSGSGSNGRGRGRD